VDVLSSIAEGKLSLQEIRREICRKSLVKFGAAAFHSVNGSAYIHGRHFDLLCRHLEAVAKKEDPVGRISRLLINMPPSTGKSYYTSVVLAPWIWTWWPSCRMLYFSYGIPRAVKDSTSCRSLIRSPWYQEMFGSDVQIEKGDDQKLFYRTTAGGWRMTSYPGGPALGEHPDIVVIDDPISIQQVGSHDNRERQRLWYFEELSTRGIAREVAHIVSHQRLHVEDLSGHILAFMDRLNAEGEYNPWHHVMLPMWFDPDRAMPDRGYGGDWRTNRDELLFPELLPDIVVESVSRNLSQQGPWAVSAQLQQKPIRRDGSLFKVSRINLQPSSEFPKLFDQVVRFWDLAGTDNAGCYTAGPAIGRIGKDPIMSKYYLLDMQRVRKSGDEVEHLVGTTGALDKITWNGENERGQTTLETYFEQEPGSSGKRVAEMLQKKFIKFGLRSVRPVADKETRAMPLATIIADGRFFVPSDAPFLSAFLAEMESFPSGEFKDQVDGCSGAVMEMVNPTYKRKSLVMSSDDRSAHRHERSKCQVDGCQRPAFGDQGKCCELCDTGRHTPRCSAAFNDWWVKTSRS
jgi:predicted phage terminase large subunit-like protein